LSESAGISFTGSQCPAMNAGRSFRNIVLSRFKKCTFVTNLRTGRFNSIIFSIKDVPSGQIVAEPVLKFSIFLLLDRFD
jgi:hypothetical protein